MNDKELFKAVKDGLISPQDALKEAESTATWLGDIIPKYRSEALPSGFKAMDEYQYLLKDESNLVVVGAMPGHGKTTWTTQIALNVAANGYNPLVFSLEMKKEALYKRLLAGEAQIPIKQLDNPKHTDRITQAVIELKKNEFRVIDEEDLTAAEIVTRTKDENNHTKVDLVVIDYVGLVKLPQDSARHEGLSHAAWLFKKKICDLLKIPVILLSQMKSTYEERISNYLLQVERAKMYGKYEPGVSREPRPMLTDIAESSGMGRHTDVLLFLNRPYLMDPTRRPEEFKVFAAKNRNGQVEDFELEFSPSMVKFFNKPKKEDDTI